MEDKRILDKNALVISQHEIVGTSQDGPMYNANFSALTSNPTQRSGEGQDFVRGRFVGRLYGQRSLTAQFDRPYPKCRLPPEWPGCQIFIGTNIPKLGKNYQMNPNYTKQP
jgi:hypothetical protein